jgi:integrase
MPLNPRPSRSVSTLKAYPSRALTLINRCRRQLLLSPHEPLDDRRLVGWLIHDKTRNGRSCWRQYKASIAHFLEQKIEHTPDPVAEEALALLMASTSEGCQKRTTKTSGSKLKKFPLRDYRRLVDHLEAHPSPWCEGLLDWLAAGLLTGLRPIEWGQCTLTTVQGETALVVDNAKATNARAHGPTRTLLLGGLDEEERQQIARHVERARGFADANDYERFRQGCAATLARTVRQIWPRRPKHATLYSLRHQFAADAKASGFSTEEIAALMGHAVDTTATQHYGRKSAGLEMVRVRPDPQEVARVRHVFKQRFEAPAPIIRPAPTVRPRMRPTPPDEGR